MQQVADEVIRLHARGVPRTPDGAVPPVGMESIITMSRDLTGLPCMTGQVHGLISDAAETFTTMAEAVDAAQRYVHVEFLPHGLGRDDRRILPGARPGRAARCGCSSTRWRGHPLWIWPFRRRGFKQIRWHVQTS